MRGEAPGVQGGRLQGFPGGRLQGFPGGQAKGGKKEEMFLLISEMQGKE